MFLVVGEILNLIDVRVLFKFVIKMISLVIFLCFVISGSDRLISGFVLNIIKIILGFFVCVYNIESGVV